MGWKTKFPAAAVLLLTMFSSAAMAECSQELRALNLGKDFDGKAVSASLKSASCRLSEPPGASIAVEFVTLSNMTASMIVAGRAEKTIGAVLGSFVIARNDVFTQFKTLVDRFGQSDMIEGAGAGVQVGRETDPLSFPAGNVNTIEIVDQINSFPATAEVVQLDEQIVPPSMNVFYVHTEWTNSDTGKTEKSDTATYWRYATLQDIANFGASVRTLNEAARQDSGLKNYNESFDWIRQDGPNVRYKKYFDYLKYISGGNNLPQEYLLLSGAYNGGCGDPSWDFNLDTPKIELDAALIRNTSSVPIPITALKLRVSERSELRPETAGGPTTSTTLSLSVTLLPGQTLVVPTGIRMRSEFGRFITESGIRGDQVYQRLLSKGIKAEPDVYGVPQRPTFLFGPQIEIENLVVSGSQVALAESQKEFVDISFSGGLGSCPYLLSWSQQERDWVEHGKVLDRARGHALEQAQTVSMSGLRTRFRLEEREAEVATLDRAELILTLKDGGEVAAAPKAGRSAPPFRLFWGEGQDFEFSPPPGITADDVVSSRLALTGYYERYSSLPALLRNVSDVFLAH